MRLQRWENGSYSGPVNTYVIDALLPKMGPCRVARRLFGITKLRSSRLAWPQFGGNPKGRGRFSLWRDPALHLAYVE